MKVLRYLLQSVWCSICISIQAQTSALDYHPFAPEGKKWETQVGLIKENVYGNLIDGDTLINGEKWKKVYNYWWSEENSWYYAAIRDVGKKVYGIAKGSNRQRLLYDFDLKEGNIVRCGVEGNTFGCLLDRDEKFDTLQGFPFESYLKVERIDTIVVRNSVLRRLTLSLLDAFKEYYRVGFDAEIGNIVWVEGVGSGAGPFSPWMPLPPEGRIYSSCNVNKNCIFTCSDFYSTDNTQAITPTESVEVNPSNEHSFDLSGRRVTNGSGLPKGIYIENGRKRKLIDK